MAVFSPAGLDTPTWAQATRGGRVPTCRAAAYVADQRLRQRAGPRLPTACGSPDRRGGPMLPLLEGKIVSVSGGSQGLGAAIARAAVREGAQAVVVTGRRRVPGEKLVAELAERNGTARFVQADLSEVAQARAAVQTAIAEFGRVDCLVNSAGLTSRGTLVDTTPELFDAHVAVNL